MDALTAQNSELRNMLVKSQENKDIYDTSATDERDTIVRIFSFFFFFFYSLSCALAMSLSFMLCCCLFQMDSLQATIRQLEAERNQLIGSLKDQRNLSDDLSVKVADMQEQVSMSSE